MCPRVLHVWLEGGQGGMKAGPDRKYTETFRQAAVGKSSNATADWRSGECGAIRNLV